MDLILNILGNISVKELNWRLYEPFQFHETSFPENKRY